MISAFATSALFAFYIETAYPDSGGDYGSLLIPAFFIAYAYVSLLVFPFSLLVDKWTKSIRHGAVSALGRVLLRVMPAAIAAGALFLFGARAGSGTLALYGMVLMFAYYAIDDLVSRLESKYRTNKAA